MYAYSADGTSGVSVGIWSGIKQSDADYVRAIANLTSADRAAAERSITLIHVVLVGAECEQPSANWRRRMSEANKALHASRYYFAFVTPSPVIRGIFTAVRWLIGAREGHYAQTFPTFEAACDWIRSNAGAYPQLDFHYARARRASAEAFDGNAANSF
jgi:hypothetical protein